MIDDPYQCFNRGVPNENKYICGYNLDEQGCVLLANSECNLSAYKDKKQDDRWRRVSELDDYCKSLAVSDNSKYNWVVKNNYYCTEEGKSECLKATIYTVRKKYNTELSDDLCEKLEPTDMKKKKCILADDETHCDEVDFSYKININKLSLLVFCLLFLL